jgi:subtilisin family serine protease
MIRKLRRKINRHGAGTQVGSLLPSPRLQIEGMLFDPGVTELLVDAGSEERLVSHLLAVNHFHPEGGSVMSKRLALVVAVAVCVALAAAVVFAGPAGNYAHKQVIIKFTDDATQSEKDAIRNALGGVTVKNLSLIDAEVWHVDNYQVEGAIQQFMMYDKIQYIEPDYIVHAFETPDDPMFDQLWGLNNTGQTGGTAGADVDALRAWDVFTGSSDVIVVVIDTGVDYNHADLAANMWVNPGEIPGNGLDDDGNGYVDDVDGWDFYNDDNDPMDDHGHGTHCSGTIGAVGNNAVGVVGVNWTVKILPLKFLGSGGTGTTSDAILAIEYATAMPGVKIMSNSWGGGGYSSALEDAIQAASDAGILFVAAAGNYVGNTDITPNYPSCYDVPNVMSIAATDHNDELCSFSGYGAVTVDLAAPGDNILSTFPGNSYGELGGTSMATPHVSGAAALIWGRFPAMTMLQVKALIMSSVDVVPGMTGLCVTDGRLNVFNCVAEPDSIAPAAVSDLAASNAASNTMDLSWTATGDDGFTGTASYYDVRYSDAPITEVNFFDAAQASGAPDPGPSGTAEAMTVTGLDFSTLYYFAVKVLDEYGNYSPISNLASGTTLGIPDIDVDPTSMSETLLTGGTSTQTLTVSNVGMGTLDYAVPQPTLILGSSVMGEYADIPKGGADSRVGDPVLQGQGGPDATGYRWIDSDELGGPTFDWVDITTIGTLVSMSGDDENTGPYPIGFDFEFYGNTFDEFRVCTNGFMSFTSTSTAYSNQPIPNAGAPENLVAPFWDDMNPSSVDRVYYYNDGTRLIVEWYDMPHYETGGPYTFEAILYPTGEIVYQYLSMEDPKNSATIGTQNFTMDDGLQVVFNNDYMHDSLTVKIAKMPQWVTVSPTSGRIYGGGSEGLSVDYDAAGLLGGTYDANVVIESNDPDEPSVTVPVELHVIGAPDIAVTPTSLDFGEVFIGVTKNKTVVVSNPGTDDLHVADIVSDNADFAASPTALTIPPRGAELVTVSYTAAAPAGLSSGTLTIQSDDPDEPEVYVGVSGTALVPPEFDVEPESLYADLMTGESEAQTLTVTNNGGSDFIFTTMVELYNSGMVEMGVFEDVEKGAEGTQTSGPQLLGTGGPDTYGYTWIDSDEPGGPVYDWVDITTLGTLIPGLDGDDENLGDFPIGFDFPFYGNTFNTFRACTNGFVTFTCTDNYYSNQELPSDYYRTCENLLAVWWEDQNFGYVERAYYYNDGSRLIITFDQVPRYSTYPEGGVYTYQVILYPNGTIIFQYETMTGYVESATVGIQNATKDDGLSVVYNAAYMHSNLAIKFAATPEWLKVSPAGGTVPPGGYIDLTALFNATDLYGGDYNGAVHIDGNDPNVPRFSVPAHLHVTGAPDIGAVPDSLDFGTVYIGVIDVLQFQVVNEGTDVLHVSDMVPGSAEFAVDPPTSFALDPLETRLVTVHFSPTAVGDRSSTLTVTSDDPDEASFVVPLIGAGLVAPDIAVTPTSVSDSLFTGQVSNHTVRVDNVGGSDLDFTIGVDLAGEVVVHHDEIEYTKEETGPPGEPQIAGTGGPDVFGYTWIDSDEPGGPMFDWIELEGIGTPMPITGDDQNTGWYSIGFDFPFYGNTFSEFRACSNGWLSFTDDYHTSLGNYELPNTYSYVPRDLLAVWWDDLNFSVGGEAYYYYDGTKTIIEYKDAPRYSSGGPYTFEVILYPNGKIVFQYLSMQGDRLDEATIGIQNGDGTDGLTVVYNADYVHDNLAVQFATSPDWLSVTPTDGTIPAGSYMDLTVRFNAAELFGGDYEGGVHIVSNDPDEGLVIVPAFLHVTGAPDIDVDPLALDFGWVYIGLDETLPVTVYNAGTDLLEVTSLTIDNAEFTTDLTPFSLNPMQSMTLDVVYTPVTEGVVTGTLTLLTNDEDEPEVYVSLAGEGVVPPEIEIDPDSVVAVAMSGMTVTETVTICNTGGSDLIYDIGAMQAERVPVYDFMFIPKDEEDPRPGILGTGGPDAFGYRWTDSDEPDGPTYDWVDISGVGTNVFGAGSYVDDGNEGPFPIGFSFDFYGNTFDSFRVCSNGFVSFTHEDYYYGNQPLPNDGYRVPENLLAVFWDDLVHRSGTGSEPVPSAVYYYNDGARLIIQFQHMYRIANYTDDINFEIILYPDGRVVYQYETMVVSTANSQTIGIQNATRDDGLTVVYDDYYIHDDMAIQFSAGPEWLSVSPASGIIPAGECEDITVTCNASALEDGVYEGVISITSNDITDPVVDCPVTFIVDWEPAVWADFDPNTLNLSSNGKWVKMELGLPLGYDPNDFLPETAFLASGGNEVGPPERFEILGPDEGIYTLMMKFNRSDVEDALTEGDSVDVMVAGEIHDITYLVGWDTIRCIRPQVNHPNGGEYFYQTPLAKIIVSWEAPESYDVDTYSVYFSADGGESWAEMASGITAQSVIVDVPGEATEQGLFRVYGFQGDDVVGYDTSDDVFTIRPADGAGTIDIVDLPKVFALKQNAPNPFRGTTMVNFALPKDVDVKLTVFDVRGRLVQNLVDQSLPAGYYSIGWNGRDINGDKVASGVYYYKIQAGPWNETKTMVYVK